VHRTFSADAETQNFADDVLVTQTVAWCALPFPQYYLPDDDDLDSQSLDSAMQGHKVPGHGAARVEINFWYFLFVYYGLYNVTALMWITKVFNIYSLNWSVPISRASRHSANFKEVATKSRVSFYGLSYRCHLDHRSDTYLLLPQIPIYRQP
jgi:hypothetical protein